MKLYQFYYGGEVTSLAACRAVGVELGMITAGAKVGYVDIIGVYTRVYKNLPVSLFKV